MSDDYAALVARLRYAGSENTTLSLLFREAAAEIERLRTVEKAALRVVHGVDVECGCEMSRSTEHTEHETSCSDVVMGDLYAALHPGREKGAESE